MSTTSKTKTRFAGYLLRESELVEDKELTHVGPGTPGGEYLRRFWQPVTLSSQLRDVPLAVRLLGEDLVLFRDLSGRVGLVHKHCPHRGVSLEFGVLDERGIRCSYHNWLIDVDGTVLETPAEPTDKLCKNVCHGAYPVKEYRGIIFAYLGPPDSVNEFPIFDVYDLPDTEYVPFSVHFTCNWLQVTENLVDPWHVPFLHGRSSGEQFPDLPGVAQLPHILFQETKLGVTYVFAGRVEDFIWLRVHTMSAPNGPQTSASFHAEPTSQANYFMRSRGATRWMVPMDNTNTQIIGWRHFSLTDEVGRRGRDEVGYEKLDLYGASKHRSYEEMQRKPGDWEVMVSQGPIAIHQREHLGSSDRGVAMLRTRLRKEIRALRGGETPTRPAHGDNHPIPTHAGDVVLRIPARGNEDVREEVAKRAMVAFLESDGLPPQTRQATIEQWMREIEAAFTKP
jgi:phenylpropionate dioxygenase-like ring-hydroxylating dioxygenase large terminal subunit